MSETPDLSTLPQRIRYAVSVLKEVDDRYRSGCGSAADEFVWRRGTLMERAAEWEGFERAVEALVLDLALDLWVLDGGTPEKFDLPYTAQTTGRYTAKARKLIESGWRKDV